MPERSNAGYVITSAIRVGDTEYVLGEIPKAPARCVTWVCRNGSDYFWGRYTDDPLSALRNLLDRAGSALEVLERRQREEAGQHED